MANHGYGLPNGRTLQPGKQAELNAFLAAQGNAIQEWKKLVTRIDTRDCLDSGCYFTSNPISFLEIRSFANMLAWQSFQGANAKGANAEGILASILDLARLNDDGTTTGLMSRWAIESIAERTARSLIACGRLDAKALRQEFESRVSWREEDLLTRALWNELVSECEDVRPRVKGAAWLLGPLEFRDSLAEMERIRGCLDLLDKPVIDAASWTTPDGQAILRARYFESCRFLTRIGLAVAEFKADTGRFPSRIEEVAALFQDGMPVDPLTGDVAIYEKAGDEVRLGPCHIAFLNDQKDWNELVEMRLAWVFL